MGGETVNDDWDSITNMFRTRASDSAPRPRLVILGTGWAALNCLRKLHCDKYDVTVISPRNFFLFTPRKPQITRGGGGGLLGYGLLTGGGVLQCSQGQRLERSRRGASSSPSESTAIDRTRRKCALYRSI